MKIDRYEAKIIDGRIQYFAIAGKKSYPMPDAFKDMYTEDYLEIEPVTFERPELFDLADPQTYIPRRTSNV